MPLTQDQKNWLLQNKGFDPQKFYVDEDRMEIMPMQSEAPANAQMAGQISAQNAAASPLPTNKEPGVLSKIWEKGTTPLLALSEETRGNINEGIQSNFPNTYKVLRPIANFGIDLGQSFTSPVGIATLPAAAYAKAIGIAGKLARTWLTSLGIGIGTQVPGAVKQTYQSIKAGDTEQAISGGLNVAATGLAGAGGLYGLRRMVSKAPPTKVQPTTSTAPVSEAALSVDLRNAPAVPSWTESPIDTFLKKRPAELLNDAKVSSVFSQIASAPEPPSTGPARTPIDIFLEQRLGKFSPEKPPVSTAPVPPQRSGLNLISEYVQPKPKLPVVDPTLEAMTEQAVSTGLNPEKIPAGSKLSEKAVKNAVIPELRVPNVDERIAAETAKLREETKRLNAIRMAEEQQAAEFAKAQAEWQAEQDALRQSRADAEQTRQMATANAEQYITQERGSVRDVEGNTRTVLAGRETPGVVPTAEEASNVIASRMLASEGSPVPKQAPGSDRFANMTREPEPVIPSETGPAITQLEAAAERYPAPPKPPTPVVEPPMVKPVERGSVIEPELSTGSPSETSILAGNTGLRSAKDIEITGRTRQLEAKARSLPTEQLPKPVVPEEFPPKEPIVRKPLEIYFEDAPKDVQEAHSGIKIKLGSKESGSLNLEPLITIGKHIYKKYQDFAKWADELRYVYGEGIRPYLSRVWSQITGGEKPLSSPALKGEATEMTRDIPGKMPSPANDPYASLPLVRSMTDEIAKRGGAKEGPHIAERTKLFQNELTRNYGKYVNEPIRIITEAKLPRASRERVYQAWLEERYGKPATIELTPEEIKVKDSLKKFLVDVHDIQRREGPLVGKEQRLAQDDPNYVPAMMSSHVSNVLSEKPGTPEFKKYREMWTNHMVEQSARKGAPITKEQAITDFENYVQARNARNKSSAEFGAVRKAEGYGLPWEMVEHDLLGAFESYGKRFGRDMAYFKAYQSDPISRRILNIADQSGDKAKNPTHFDDGTQISSLPSNLHSDLMDYISGHYKSGVISEAAGNVAKSGMIQAYTGVGNLIGNIGHRFPYIPANRLGVAAKALTRIAKGRAAGLRQGIIRGKVNDISSIVRSNDALATALNKAADVNYKLSGSQLIENIDRAADMIMGIEIAQADFGQAAGKGKLPADSFAKRFSYNVDIGRYEGKPLSEIPADVYEKIAANYVEKVQGSYGPSGVPRIMMKGNSVVTPFLSLMKWPTEKLNNTYKDAIVPILEKGNFKPLFKFMAGAMLSGTALSYIMPQISNRKDFLPTITEAWKSEDPKLMALALVNIAKLGALGGLGANLLTIGTSVLTGRKPMGMTWPALDLTVDAWEKFMQSVEAVKEGEEIIPTVAKATLKFLQDHIQNLRLLSNHFWASNEADLANAKRNLRLFEFSSGTGNSSSSDQFGGNPLLTPELRNWRKAKTPEEIVEAAGPVSKWMRREITETPLNARNVISRLRYAPQYPMPNPETDPARASEYYKFREKLHGEEAAKEMVSKWRQQKDANKMKSQLIGN